jgi:hypothetical protein
VMSKRDRSRVIDIQARISRLLERPKMARIGEIAELSVQLNALLSKQLYSECANCESTGHDTGSGTCPGPGETDTFKKLEK